MPDPRSAPCWSRSSSASNPSPEAARRPLWALALGLFGLALSAACSFGPPNAIDVSAYPADMQQRYALFSHKCSRCHSLERPLQAHVGVRGWGDYVRRMSQHPGAGISEDEQREIATFLQYHSQREAERQK